MKKYLALIAIGISLVSCSCGTESFQGYVVRKEFTPEHMSDKPAKTQVQAQFSSGATTMLLLDDDEPELIKESYVLFVANHVKVKKYPVSKSLYEQTVLGQKITMKY